MSHIKLMKKIKQKSLCKSDSKIKSKYIDMLSEASSWISFRRIAGSFSVEAALVLPLFLWFVITLFYFFIFINIQGDITLGMSKVCKELGQYQFCQEEYSNYFTENYVKESILCEIKKSKFNNSCIKDGLSGINCKLDNINKNRIDILLKYNFHVPVPLFDLAKWPVVQRSYVHSWTGFDKNETNKNQEETVYITEDGSAYHKYRSCAYLDLNIRSVEMKDISKIRNKSGRKYLPCEKCVKSKQCKIVYITDWGDKYHTSLNCSGLKRTVYAVPISQVGNRHKCPKCWK
ncbi:TadE/TadG family type IV pilus assembly protein [Anaerosacchariphilus polymeriproducens]|uniref:Pilus assembly protein n=1 Tax=Anaerosacchariphilus polymeriproducens TaxID=1812858 RepID=A0A371AZV0_9FIRM|nr:hypothetical protein [Anaerosacchariphilus polymeriproducens]RDU25076.1 hypothetical protein DWV06_00830 [Anaerosacchariphilus polymeriproducens]